jgi:hypothetical protein
MTESYTEYGYRGLEEIKKLEEEINRLKAIIIQLKAQSVVSRLEIKNNENSK